MKKFTVKDFILYNSPCFICNHENNFYFEIDKTGESPNFIGRVSKRAMVTKDYTSVELIVHYSKNLFIKIDHKTNKFTTSSVPDLINYLKENSLSMRISCTKCAASITTNYLDFNLDKLFVYPATLHTEMYLVVDENNSYSVCSSFNIKKQSILTVSKNSDIKKNVHKPQTLYLPLIPIYKFKTREKFLNKIKTYIIFS